MGWSRANTSRPSQAALKSAADAGANAMGMRIAAVSLSGQRQVSREEIFAARA
jgi:hypothetical protein